MKTDYHIHTEFSCDSEAKMEQYVKQALARDTLLYGPCGLKSGGLRIQLLQPGEVL